MNTKKTYQMPEVAVVNLRMEDTFLQTSDHFTLQDYGEGISDEWS